MKELLEEYVLEAVGMRQQVELLSRLVSVLWADLEAEDAADGPIDIKELEGVTILDIRIEDGQVHLG